MSAGPAVPGTPGAIYFLTDYGYSDELAGVVRAVLGTLAPAAPVVDLTHGIDPFDVRAGALALERAAPHLGPGVVLAVVDPGVGTNRRAVAIGVGGVGGPHALVGPDNGLLGPVADCLGGSLAAVTLDPARVEGAVTFDGRDVFAPAAAALWRGTPLEQLGEPVSPEGLVRLAGPHLAVGTGGIEAEVLWVDHFGNVQLAATAADGRAAGIEMGNPVHVVAGDGVLPGRVVRAFADLDGGDETGTEVGVLVDANGHLAVVCPRRPAATVLGVQPGAVVTLRRADGETRSP